MKILLLGEYSNVHNLLEQGLRALGHEVTLLSNGDFWKDYPRDISLVRRNSGHWAGLCYMARLLTLLPRLRGYDIVQLINPMFLELKAERIFPVYRYLRRHNRHIVLGAFGMDYYWVNTCVTQKPLRYSDFNFGDRLREDEAALRERADWTGGTAKERLNKMIALDADAIVTGLYEYDVCYRPSFPDKTVFIPFPIVADSTEASPLTPHPVHIFVGISKNRSAYKGTDIMLRAARRIADRYAGRVVLDVACGLPFAEYVERMKRADLLLDQLYSYTPAMNALEAMNQGIVVVGGGEPENYAILNEEHLRPIANVEPTEESVYQVLGHLVEHPEEIPQLKREGKQYIQKHHDHLIVARRYEKLYTAIASVVCRQSKTVLYRTDVT